MTRHILASMGFLRNGLLIGSALSVSCAAKAAEVRFSFTTGDARPDFTQVTPQTVYDAKKGFGFLGLPSPAALVDRHEKGMQFAVDV